MKSLFLRLLVSMWATMVVIVGVFALIHAFAFSSQIDGGRRRFAARSTQNRAEHALLCARSGLGDCERSLRPLEERDPRVAVYRGDVLVMGEPVEGAADVVGHRIATRTTGGSRRPTSRPPSTASSARPSASTP